MQRRNQSLLHDDWFFFIHVVPNTRASLSHLIYLSQLDLILFVCLHVLFNFRFRWQNCTFKLNTQTHIARRYRKVLNLFKSIIIHPLASKSFMLLVLVVYSINLTRLMIICNVQVKMHVIITVTVPINVILVKTMVVQSNLPGLGENNKHQFKYRILQ